MNFFLWSCLRISLFPSSVLKYSFIGYSGLGWQLHTVKAWNILFHAFQGFRVSVERFHCILTFTFVIELVFCVTTFNILCLHFWHMNYNVAWGVCSLALSVCAGYSLFLSLDVPWLLLSVELCSEISADKSYQPTRECILTETSSGAGLWEHSLWVVAVPAMSTCDAAALTLHLDASQKLQPCVHYWAQLPLCTAVLGAFFHTVGPWWGS